MAELPILTVEQLRYMWLLPVTAEDVTGEGTPLYKRWRFLSERYERTKPFASKELRDALFILNTALSIEILNTQPKGLEPTLEDLPEPNDPRPPWHDQPVNPEKGEPPTPA